MVHVQIWVPSLIPFVISPRLAHYSPYNSVNIYCVGEKVDLYEQVGQACGR
jgi:hypothetical protein